MWESLQRKFCECVEKRAPVFVAHLAKNGAPPQHVRDLHVDQMGRVQRRRAQYPTLYRRRGWYLQQQVDQDRGV